MKKILLLFVLIILILSGCANSGNTMPQKEAVKINLPQDDKVNGYRNEDYISSDKISWDDITIGDKISTENLYCGNKNSKKLHKISCGALKNTKEENKVYYNTKEEYINLGYSPCQICKP